MRCIMVFCVRRRLQRNLNKVTVHYSGERRIQKQIWKKNNALGYEIMYLQMKQYSTMRA